MEWKIEKVELFHIHRIDDDSLAMSVLGLKCLSSSARGVDPPVLLNRDVKPSPINTDCIKRRSSNNHGEHHIVEQRFCRRYF